MCIRTHYFSSPHFIPLRKVFEKRLYAIQSPVLSTTCTGIPDASTEAASYDLAMVDHITRGDWRSSALSSDRIEMTSMEKIPSGPVYVEDASLPDPGTPEDDPEPEVSLSTIMAVFVRLPSRSRF